MYYGGNRFKSIKKLVFLSEIDGSFIFKAHAKVAITMHLALF